MADIYETGEKTKYLDEQITSNKANGIQLKPGALTYLKLQAGEEDFQDLATKTNMSSTEMRKFIQSNGKSTNAMRLFVDMLVAADTVTTDENQRGRVTDAWRATNNVGEGEQFQRKVLDTWLDLRTRAGGNLRYDKNYAVPLTLVDFKAVASKLFGEHLLKIESETISGNADSADYKKFLNATRDESLESDIVSNPRGSAGRHTRYVQQVSYLVTGSKVMDSGATGLHGPWSSNVKDIIKYIEDKWVGKPYTSGMHHFMTGTDVGTIHGSVPLDDDAARARAIELMTNHNMPQKLKRIIDTGVMKKSEVFSLLGSSSDNTEFDVRATKESILKYLPGPIMGIVQLAKKYKARVIAAAGKAGQVMSGEQKNALEMLLAKLHKEHEMKGSQEEVQLWQALLMKQEVKDVEEDTDFTAGKPAQVRMMEQCYLMSFVDKFSAISKTSQLVTPNGGMVILEGEASVITNKLLSRAGIKPMMDITPAQAALLTPKIELYKVTYANDSVKKSTEKPFVFEDHLSKNKVSAILKGRAGRGEGVGIKSINFDWQGTDMESAERIVMATIVLYVQDLTTFTKPARPGAAAPMDLLVPQKLLKGKKGKSWVRDKKSGQLVHYSQIANSMNFEIKAVIGWSLPSKLVKLINKDLRIAINNSKLTTLMTLNNHNIDFNQDGSANITVEYHGRLEGLLDDDYRTNIFAESAGEVYLRDKAAKQVEKTTAQMKAHMTSDSAHKRLVMFMKTPIVEKALAKAPPAVQKGKEADKISWIAQYNPSAVPKIREYTQLLRDTHELTVAGFEDEIAKADSLVQTARADKHVQLIRELEIRRAIRTISVDKVELDSYMKLNAGSMGTWGSGSKYDRRVPPFTSVGTPAQANRAVSIAQAAADKVKAKEEAKVKATAAITEKKSPAGDTSAEKKSKKPSVSETGATDMGALMPIVASGRYQFSYFFLGELIQAAISSIRKRNTDANHYRFSLLTGPLTYSHPITEEPVSVNLADIPISLNLFLDWYTKSVVEQGLTKWPLGRFLRKIATTMIFPALGGVCYEAAPNIAMSSKKLSMDVFSVPRDILKKEPRVHINAMAGAFKTMNRAWSANLKASGLHEYILLRSTFTKPSHRKGNKRDDESEGIFHLTLGRDRGLVKEIKFSRNDMPYFFESRLAMESEIDRIKHPYNADIRLIGNTYFRPGMQLYLNPSLTGMGDPKNKNSVVSKLGLGGYYVVLGSTMKIEGGTFENTLRAQFTSYGFQGSRMPESFAARKSKSVPFEAPTAPAEIVFDISEKPMTDMERVQEKLLEAKTLFDPGMGTLKAEALIAAGNIHRVRENTKRLDREVRDLYKKAKQFNAAEAVNDGWSKVAKAIFESATDMSTLLPSLQTADNSEYMLINAKMRGALDTLSPRLKFSEVKYSFNPLNLGNEGKMSKGDVYSSDSDATGDTYYPIIVKVATPKGIYQFVNPESDLFGEYQSIADEVRKHKRAKIAHEDSGKKEEYMDTKDVLKNTK